jgi:hypothetical protein
MEFGIEGQKRRLDGLNVQTAHIIPLVNQCVQVKRAILESGRVRNECDIIAKFQDFTHRRRTG